MQQPEHLRASVAAQPTPRRFLTFGLVALFHVVVIYAFATGLAANMATHALQEIKAQVVPPKLPNVKPPPPPPPELAKPPPPFVPPPEINIQAETTNTSPITVTHAPPQQVAKVEAPPVTTPVSIGKAHECNSMFYPPIAQRLGQEGTTVVAFHITPDGDVTDPRVSESSGHDSLDEAALRCVATWHYKPATQSGHPIEAPWQARVVWKLSG